MNTIERKLNGNILVDTNDTVELEVVNDILRNRAASALDFVFSIAYRISLSVISNAVLPMPYMYLYCLLSATI